VTFTSTWSPSTSISWLVTRRVKSIQNFKFLSSSWQSQLVITLRSTSIWSLNRGRCGNAITDGVSGRMDVEPEGKDKLLPRSQLKRLTPLFPKSMALALSYSRIEVFQLQPDLNMGLNGVGNHKYVISRLRLKPYLFLLLSWFFQLESWEVKSRNKRLTFRMLKRKLLKNELKLKISSRTAFQTFGVQKY
jgi:hypothetical protein